MGLSIAVLFVVILGATLAYFLNTPVPNDFEEPWKYRLLVATMNFHRLVARIYAKLRPGNAFASIQMVRYLRTMISAPTPSEVPGSNIRSKVTTFDGVRVILYEPIVREEGGLQPALIYMHGGGFAFGSADTFDQLTRDIAEQLKNMVVVSIDYRLAPEHPFPTPYEDSLRATTWLLRHAEEFNVDPTRIAIAGESAGGNLAAGISQAVHDDPSLPELRLQVMIYPFFNTYDFMSPSMQLSDEIYGDDGILPRRALATFTCVHNLGRIDPLHVQQMMANEHVTESFRNNSPQMGYLNHSVIPEDIRQTTRDLKAPWKPGYVGNESLWEILKPTFLDPRWSPLMRQDLTNLPQAFVATCNYDSIRDDGIFYAKRLEAAGVKTEWKHYQKGFHGVFYLIKPFRFKLGDVMLQDMISFVKANI